MSNENVTEQEGGLSRQVEVLYLVKECREERGEEPISPSELRRFIDRRIGDGRQTCQASLDKILKKMPDQDKPIVVKGTRATSGETEFERQLQTLKNYQDRNRRAIKYLARVLSIIDTTPAIDNAVNGIFRGELKIDELYEENGYPKALRLTTDKS